MKRLVKFLLGLAIGAGVAMLLAPKSGRELRERLMGGATSRLLPPGEDRYAPAADEPSWQAAAPSWSAPAATAVAEPPVDEKVVIEEATVEEAPPAETAEPEPVTEAALAEALASEAVVAEAAAEGLSAEAELDAAAAEERIPFRERKSAISPRFSEIQASSRSTPVAGSTFGCQPRSSRARPMSQ
jgi:hypothetical protein